MEPQEIRWGRVALRKSMRVARLLMRPLAEDAPVDHDAHGRLQGYGQEIAFVLPPDPHTYPRGEIPGLVAIATPLIVELGEHAGIEDALMARRPGHFAELRDALGAAHLAGIGHGAQAPLIHTAAKSHLMSEAPDLITRINEAAVQWGRDNPHGAAEADVRRLMGVPASGADPAGRAMETTRLLATETAWMHRISERGLGRPDWERVARDLLTFAEQLDGRPCPLLHAAVLSLSRGALHNVPLTDPSQLLAASNAVRTSDAPAARALCASLEACHRRTEWERKALRHLAAAEASAASIMLGTRIRQASPD